MQRILRSCKFRIDAGRAGPLVAYATTRDRIRECHFVNRRSVSKDPGTSHLRQPGLPVNVIEDRIATEKLASLVVSEEAIPSF